MRTKLIFTIIDGDHTFRVYMRDDYPYDEYESIKEAIREFPRFEVYLDRALGPAFVAANKKFSEAYPGAEVHLTTHYRCKDDLEFRYELFINDNETYIREYEIDYRKELKNRGKTRQLFEGSLEKFFDSVNYMDEEESIRARKEAEREEEEYKLGVFYGGYL